jgi:DNA mismatch repair protein MutS
MTKRTETIYEEYFRLLDQYKRSHGPRTFLLLEVGSFYEVYSARSSTDYNTMVINQEIYDFAAMSNLKIATKSNMFYNIDKTEPICMCGFRNVELDDYLPKLCIDHGYQVVIYNQEDIEGNKEKRRVFDRIVSPSTFVSSKEESTKLTNNIMCIWIKRAILKKVEIMVCGISTINILTGESSMYEYEHKCPLNDTQYDDLERCISIYVPSEVILITGEQDYETVADFFQPNVCIRWFNLTDSKVTKASQQTYIDAILTNVFSADRVDTATQFQDYRIATQSFGFLLDYINLHNPQLISRISMPYFDNQGNRVILANHVLQQLNIIPDGQSTGKWSSIQSAFNTCITPIGKRMYQQMLTHPTIDIDWLSTEYEMIEYVSIKATPSIPDLRKSLSGIHDISQLARLILLGKATPNSMARCYASLENLNRIYDSIRNDRKLIEYLGELEQLPNIIEFIRERLNIQQCIGVHRIDKSIPEDTEKESEDSDTNEQRQDLYILNQGVFPEFDAVYRELNQITTLSNTFLTTLNDLCQQQNPPKKKSATTPIKYINLHTTEKMGYSFQITKLRTKVLNEVLESRQTIHITEDLIIRCSDVKIVSAASSNSNEVIYEPLQQLCKTRWALKDRFISVITKEYAGFLAEFTRQWYDDMEKCVAFIGRIDVLLCRAYNALEYNLCKPQLIQGESQIDAVNLRHPLIEHLLKDELYVPNDVSLNGSGMLLFGINSAGKTSLLRSIGIAILLAQTGQYVPCERFALTPYRSIYTRIIGNDNLFKGQSSFTVEMSELKVILERADRGSLVLADEISKGSEIDSAECITVATLLHLSQQSASYMITSHLHEIMEMTEVIEMPRLSIKHLYVRFDAEQDLLIYDRHLKDGSGPSFYGLDVCRSLHMPSDFIEKTFIIREKYMCTNTCSILSSNTSPYNARKVIGMCEICGTAIGSEVHHLSPQKGANERGFLSNGAHKNFLGNLSSTCEKCHLAIHASGKQLVRKKTSQGSKLIVETQINL